MIHTSVLLHESIEGLNLKAGDIVVDATLNGGGHSQAMVEQWGKTIRLIGIDLDADAIARAKIRLGDADVTFVQDNFRNISTILDTLHIEKINAILFDLGTSSNQIEESGRGFSFKTNEPLLMTLKSNPDSQDITAFEVVNEWQEQSLIDIIEGYGEEQFAWRIAKAIVAAREVKPIETTEELARIIKDATPIWYHFKKIHPATKTFQAIRISVNDELQALKQALSSAFDRLSPAGRMSVISFHSLEDRIVKRFFKEKAEADQALLINKKPIIASDQEISENPRSRSAKLRILEKSK